MYKKSLFCPGSRSCENMCMHTMVLPRPLEPTACTSFWFELHTSLLLKSQLEECRDVEGKTGNLQSSSGAGVKKARRRNAWEKFEREGFCFSKPWGFGLCCVLRTWCPWIGPGDANCSFYSSFLFRRWIKMQHTTCTEDRIHHALERCLHGLSRSAVSSTTWTGRGSSICTSSQGTEPPHQVLYGLGPLNEMYAYKPIWFSFGCITRPGLMSSWCFV